LGGYQRWGENQQEEKFPHIVYTVSAKVTIWRQGVGQNTISKT
jgi:hypothetical protein